jgi:hypothetical protein
MRGELEAHLNGLAAGELSGAESLFSLVDEAKEWLAKQLPQYLSGKRSVGTNRHTGGTDGGGGEAREENGAESVEEEEEEDGPKGLRIDNVAENEEENFVLMREAIVEATEVNATAANIPVTKRGRWQYVVGLVGKPSAGKSTFFNAVTKSAAAKMASYPFTTIEPNIGA